MMTPPRMSIVSRTVDIPPPRRGRRELAEDTGVRLGEALVLRADEAARGIEQRMAEAFTVRERQQLTEMLGRVTALLRGDLSAE